MKISLPLVLPIRNGCGVGLLRTAGKRVGRVRSASGACRAPPVRVGVSFAGRAPPTSALIFSWSSAMEVALRNVVAFHRRTSGFASRACVAASAFLYGRARLPIALRNVVAFCRCALSFFNDSSVRTATSALFSVSSAVHSFRVGTR